MGVAIRTAVPDDLDVVLALNEAAVPNVNSVPLRQLEWFRVEAPYFRVATLQDRVAGFLIALTRGLGYESVNYRWFQDRYPSFVYVDRIVTADWARRSGVGRALYEDLFAFTRSRAPMITCEVNLHPPNAGSLAFHHEFGFTEVGTQETEGGRKTVSLMACSLEDG